MQNKNTKYTNELIHETSPYLLQHAHNPVNWMAWGDKALEKAKAENKLLLISVGYSACHWCHVMEHECFENEKVAAIMNEHFVCIKVDREERPDIDNIYMLAVQLMTGRGGWPLNCFALPDGKPVYGGTYFPADQWMNILMNIQEGYSAEPEKFKEYADKLTQGIKISETFESKEDAQILSKEDFKKAIADFKHDWDWTDGGMNRAPKFPLPNTYNFLLRYYIAERDEEVLKFISHTLTRIAQGGIYDQVGGGFARYSVDGYWKVPHFEKMLYDNAQLVSLYAEAYQLIKNEYFKQVVEQTIGFLMRDLRSEDGYFYAALDADSEGEEGKFYVWTESEIEGLFDKDAAFVKDMYCIGKEGLWEHGNSIPLLNKDLQSLKKKYELNDADFEIKYKNVTNLLLEVRNKRIWPARDEKTVVSWNALAVKGLLDAYVAMGTGSYFDTAKKHLDFILTKCRRKDGGLYHSLKNNGDHVNGFLEDYAFVISALIKIYEISGELNYIKDAKQLVEYSFEKFLDKESKLFYFTSEEDTPLIARKFETIDNVIPASNSEMANNLFLMGKVFAQQEWIEHANKMFLNIQPHIAGYVSGYSNWCINYLNHIQFKEVVVCGNNAKNIAKQLLQQYLPFKIVLHSEKAVDLPLFADRFIENKTMIYICSNNVCSLPTENYDEAIKQLH